MITAPSRQVRFTAAIAGQVAGVLMALCYLLLPPVLSTMHGANVWAENVPRAVAWIAHAVYGGALGITYGWLAGTETRPPADDRD